MIVSTDKGLYCPAGDFFVDPWAPVPRAVITHAHADHARGGSDHYLCTRESLGIIRYRIGSDISVQALEYGEPVFMNGIRLSLHPAGHILGSAQVRLEHNGEVWLISGDYKRQPDPTCLAYEPLKCNVFITESTFGLPIYKWSAEAVNFEQINLWWRRNQDEGKASVLLAYSLGKAQRILMGIDSSIGPVYTHGATEAINEIYRASGIRLPETKRVVLAPRGTSFSRALILAPPSVQSTAWMRRFGSQSIAFASGWMKVRGMRRRSAVDRGFAVSDHADWNDLLATIADTSAERVLVTHGYSEVLARHLCEMGLDARTIKTEYQGESEEPAEATFNDLHSEPIASDAGGDRPGGEKG